MRYGVNFKLPSQSDVRKYVATKPDAFLQSHELHVLLAKASLQLKAMIMLGINCAYGNRDCSELRLITWTWSQVGLSTHAAKLVCVDV